MSWFEAVLLGLLQGLTEFLPVSSSGHLVIGQELLGLNTTAADNLQFIVTVHAATVLSTLVVLRREVAQLFRGTFLTAAWNNDKVYVAKIGISMIPVFVVGVFFKDQVEQLFGEGLLLVGCCLLLTAILLAFAYYAKPRQRSRISYRDAFIIGLAQAVAVLPGLSRSGSTIATGLLLGNQRESVAHFSFLMVLIPVLGQCLLDIIDGLSVSASATTASGPGFLPLIAGFAAAFVSGLFACRTMIGLVKRGKLIWFAVYCVAAGLLSILYSLYTA